MRLWMVLKQLTRIVLMLFLFSLAVNFIRSVRHGSKYRYFQDVSTTNIVIGEQQDVLRLTTIPGEEASTCKLDYNCPPGESLPHAPNNTPVSPVELTAKFDSMQHGGSWSPMNCTGPRLAVVIPFRDRHAHLWVFLNNIIPFLQRQQVHFRIFLIEQAIPEVFNRASLLNIGFLEASKLDHFDCFIFHDVDLIPEDWCNLYTCSRSPRHLAVAIDKFDYRLPYSYYAGGALALHRTTVNLMNGFTNIMFGWGGEDDDTYYRFVRHNLHLDRYNDSIAKYKMLDHDRDITNPAAARTSQEARFHWKFSSYDGLNSANYSLIYMNSTALFTHLHVKLYGPLNLQESNVYFRTQSQKLKRRLLSDRVEKEKVIAVKRRLIKERKQEKARKSHVVANDLKSQ